MYLLAGSGKCNFDAFATIVGHFLEEEDAEAMQQELKEAFRLYDKEGARDRDRKSLPARC